MLHALAHAAPATVLGGGGLLAAAATTGSGSGHGGGHGGSGYNGGGVAAAAAVPPSLESARNLRRLLELIALHKKVLVRHGSYFLADVVAVCRERPLPAALHREVPGPGPVALTEALPS